MIPTNVDAIALRKKRHGYRERSKEVEIKYGEEMESGVGSKKARSRVFGEGL